MEDYEFAEEQDKQAFVEHLLQNDYLTHPAEIGVARQYVDQGYASLKGGQPAVIDSILETHAVSECDSCSNSIPWSEQVEALDSGICGYCQHRWDRMADE